jgi:predicted enzyme related to lactoylglutathione lyase
MGNPVVHFDISGPDPEELQKFYGELFGWKIDPVPEMNYALVDTQGGSGINGGIGKAPEGPGQVAFYVMADDLQAVLDKAESLGGKTTQPVMNIPGAVTLAMFADPEGHEVGLVGGGDQMETQQGAPSSGSGAPVAWFEVMGGDGAGLVSFSTELFGWTSKKYEVPGFDYWEMDSGSEVGIKGGIGTGPQGQSYATVYASVPDVEARLEKAVQLGATTVMPPTAMPSLTIAMFTDPQGHVFGMFTPH